MIYKELGIGALEEMIKYIIPYLHIGKFISSTRLISHTIKLLNLGIFE